MIIQFTKMHGLGNDFVVIDAVSQHVSIRPSQIKKLSDRHTGIGFDQLLLVEPPSRPDADFDYRIFNSDGEEVENCGNGARCFAKFVTDRGLIAKPTIIVNTFDGLIELTLVDASLILVNMGQPCLDMSEFPYQGPPEIYGKNTVQLSTPMGLTTFGLVSMGNPHAVTLITSWAETHVESVGKFLQGAPQFPNSVNVSFLEIISRSEVRLRVYERGVGETLACGTGACAAVTFGHLADLLDNKVTVATLGGNLQIKWDGIGHDLIMTGPAESVFEGEFRL